MSTLLSLERLLEEDAPSRLPNGYSLRKQADGYVLTTPDKEVKLGQARDSEEARAKAYKVINKSKTKAVSPVKEPATRAPAQPSSKVMGLLKKSWHTVAEPFHAAYKLVTDKKYRKETKEKIVTAFKKEAAETKKMVGTFRNIVTGKEVSAEDKKAAVHQLVDVAKGVLMVSFAGHMAAEDLTKFLATVASPAEEIAGALLDKPIRAVTKKLLGVEHGLLPSAFYEAEGEDLTDDEIIGGFVNLLMHELESQSVSPDDEEDKSDGALERLETLLGRVNA